MSLIRVKLKPVCLLDNAPLSHTPRIGLLADVAVVPTDNDLER
jgi:hypothetical protein